MDTFLDLQTGLQDDLTINTTSSLYPLALQKRVLNRSYIKCSQLFRWPELEDAKKTSSVLDQEYYDYPQGWQPDSIWKLKVDDVDYGDPLVFKDYLYEKENSIPSGLTYLWTSQWRRFFVYPTPTTNGSNNICVWGQKVVTALSSDADVTIFSYSMPECNEALVLEAAALMKTKGDRINESQFISNEAKELLTIAFGKVRQNQAKYEKTTSFFEVPDFFRRGRGGGNTSNGSPIGNF